MFFPVFSQPAYLQNKLCGKFYLFMNSLFVFLFFRACPRLIDGEEISRLELLLRCRDNKISRQDLLVPQHRNRYKNFLLRTVKLAHLEMLDVKSWSSLALFCYISYYFFPSFSDVLWWWICIIVNGIMEDSDDYEFRRWICQKIFWDILLVVIYY